MLGMVPLSHGNSSHQDKSNEMRMMSSLMKNGYFIDHCLDSRDWTTLLSYCGYSISSSFQNVVCIVGMQEFYGMISHKTNQGMFSLWEIKDLRTWDCYSKLDCSVSHGCLYPCTGPWIWSLKQHCLLWLSCKLNESLLWKTKSLKNTTVLVFWLIN
jgi:hypothetical protein